MKLVVNAALLLLVLCSEAAIAQVSVLEPWARATVTGQKAGGVFMKLSSKQKARLVDAQSPAAGAVEIHEMAMHDNVMRMRAIAGIDLPAGRSVELKPGGYHLMLMNLRAPLKAGDSVALTLIFEGADGKRESVSVSAAVRPLTQGTQRHDAQPGGQGAAGAAHKAH